jgi:putative NADH-flavin reductase
MVRAPGAFEVREGLRIEIGDPTRPANLMRAALPLPARDAVISRLGQRARRDATLLQNAAAATLQTMVRSGVRRYLVVSQGLLFPSSNPMIALLRLFLARHVADSTAMERLIVGSNMDCTFVRPPRLLQGGVARGYRIEVGARPRGSWAMQRGDLAA